MCRWLAYGELPEAQSMHATYAYAKFTSCEHVAKALSLSGSEFLGRLVRTSVSNVR